jgi:phosphoglucosamine mutase
MGQYFGTDGIRGIANTELTPEFTLGLGRAVVRTLREEGIARPQIVIGRDPRASGHMLESALAAGICSAGGDAILLGVVPTPAVAYLTPHLGVDSGAVISASHNPVGDNGIKFFGPTGYKLTDAEEDRVEELLQLTYEDRPEGADIGRVRDAHDTVAVYLDHLARVADADCAALKVVVDCANGAASTVAPAVLERLGCEVVTICAEPDGANINAGCGSTHPERMAAAVVEHRADLGIAHDGDADRLIAADAAGGIVDGDQILAILAERERQERGLHTVVTTVMTNLGFTQAMEQRGVEVIQTKVGDRYVLEAMRAGGHPLGGEQSGHLILARHATTGDGVLSAVALLSAVADAGKPLADLAAIMTRLPQVLVNVRGVDRDRLDEAKRLWAAVREVETELDGSGRVLVRASGTEPLVRVMVEAETEDTATAVAERLAGIASEELALDRA